MDVLEREFSWLTEKRRMMNNASGNPQSHVNNASHTLKITAKINSFNISPKKKTLQIPLNLCFSDCCCCWCKHYVPHLAYFPYIHFLTSVQCASSASVSPASVAQKNQKRVREIHFFECLSEAIDRLHCLWPVYMFFCIQFWLNIPVLANCSLPETERNGFSFASSRTRWSKVPSMNCDVWGALYWEEGGQIYDFHRIFGEIDYKILLRDTNW